MKLEETEKREMEICIYKDKCKEKFQKDILGLIDGWIKHYEIRKKVYPNKNHLKRIFLQAIIEDMQTLKQSIKEIKNGK